MIYKSLNHIPVPPQQPPHLLWMKREKNGNLWLTEHFGEGPQRGMIVLRDSYEGTTFENFESFHGGKPDFTFSKLDGKLEQIGPDYLTTRLARMEMYALTNFIEVPYSERVAEPPLKDFVKSEPYFEKRVRALNAKVYLVLMGKGKNHDYNQYAVEIIRDVFKKNATIFESYHPRSWLKPEIIKDAEQNVRGFLKKTGMETR